MSRAPLQMLLRTWAVGALFCLWWVASHFAWVSPYLLPSPETVCASFVRLAQSGELASHVGASFARSLTGYAFAAGLAVPLGYLFSQKPKWLMQSNLLLESLRMIPPLSLIPLLIVWLGIGEAPKIAIVVLASFFPIYLNALSGFSQIDGRYRDLAYMLDMNKREKWRYIELPGALPHLFTGLRIGFGYSWRALIGAELIAASSGIGFLITEAGQLARTDEVIVGIFCIAVLGVVADSLLKVVMVRLAPWSKSWT